MYTREQVQSELQRLFNQQYTLTITPVTEIRYRTETRTGSYTDAEGNSHSYTYTVEVPYNYYILGVRLTNRSLGSVALSNLNAEQAEMYAVYMETQGNKPELFADNVYVNRGEYTDYDIPPEALTDTVFAAMITEAEKYLGYAYVWGGSSPSTSFDCSGFVSWVVNHSGWSLGRLTANGLMGRCAIIPPGEARPGDLIFFQGTYDVSGASHDGIYVGGGMMIQCGYPIAYASIATSYWTNHFYCFGRLP
jgi:cell wall-associated NlpC family hydrolase